MSHRVVNFNAGPATLPLAVLEEAREGIVDYRGSGMGVMEMSHRSAVYDEIHQGLVAAISRLLGLGDEHAVLLLQGGASLQFSMVPMNLLPEGGSADHLVTGEWSKKALVEAAKVGTARVAATTEAESFRRLPSPTEIDLDPRAAYLHATSNNTIYGTQWRDLPAAGDLPLVVDASSDFLSRPLPLAGLGLVYAGAQKNLGPSGLTVVVVRRDLLERAPRDLPTMLQYRTHAAKDSLYNTPPTWAIYVAGLVCRWLEAQGGLPAAAARNEEKAALLYARLDAGGFYRGTAEPTARSLMNVTFRLPSEELEKRFLAEATAAGLVGLKGHRSVGGCRASLYNAMTREGVEALVGFMDDFAARHG